MCNNTTKLKQPKSQTLWVYDGLDRNSQIQVSGSAFAWYNYDHFGRVDYMCRSDSKNGARTDLRYDSVNRVNGLSHDFTGTSADFNNSFTYLPSSQLGSIHFANDQYQYIGNEKLVGSYKVNGLNQYTNIAGVSAKYDTKGNLHKYDGVTYEYDEENRLVKVLANKTTGFSYDPLGRLSRISSDGGYRDLLWDGDALVAEYDSAGTAPIARYAHGAGMDVPILQYEGASIVSLSRQYIHADQKGSVVAYSEYDGDIVGTNSYDEYGIPGLENQGRFGYTGQLWLPEVGLYYYKARMYHPRIGRFLQTDPIGYEDQMNLYAYVGNDPMNATDPTGEAINLITGGIGALVGGVVGVGIELATSSNYSAGGFAGAFAGGAVTGGLIGLTGGASLAVTTGVASVSGAVGGATDSVIQQGVDTGGVQAAPVITSAVVGAATPGAGKLLGKAALSGVNAGKGSLKASAAGVLSKVEAGTAKAGMATYKNVAATYGVQGGAIEGAAGAIASGSTAVNDAIGGQVVNAAACGMATSECSQ